MACFLSLLVSVHFMWNGLPVCAVRLTFRGRRDNVSANTYESETHLSYTDKREFLCLFEGRNTTA